MCRMHVIRHFKAKDDSMHYFSRSVVSTLSYFNMRLTKKSVTTSSGLWYEWGRWQPGIAEIIDIKLANVNNENFRVTIMLTI